MSTFLAVNQAGVKLNSVNEDYLQSQFLVELKLEIWIIMKYQTFAVENGLKIHHEQKAEWIDFVSHLVHHSFAVAVK